MLNHRLAASIATATTLAATAGALTLAAAPASAAKVLPADITALPRAGEIRYGTVEFSLSSRAAAKLGSAGGKITGTGGAEVKGRALSFEADEKSVIDPTTMRGTLLLQGGLTLKGKAKTAKLRTITLEPGIEKRVTAKLGSKRIELGTLKGGKAKMTRQADGALSGAKLSLSASAAKKLNAATGGGFAAGSFATVGATVTGRELPLGSGVATVTIDAGLMKTLTDSGYAITAEAPATASGAVVTIPLTGGAFDPIELTGRLALEGKVTIGKAGSGITLFGWRSALGGGQNDLYANFNDNASAQLATVDTSAMTMTLEGKKFFARGAKLSLSKIATDVMKQQFGVSVAPGTPMGAVDIDGSLSGE